MEPDQKNCTGTLPRIDKKNKKIISPDNIFEL